MTMTSKEERVEPHQIFEALSDPQRAAILKALRKKGEMSFTELMKTINVASGRVAFQLSKLSSLLEKTEEKYKLSPLGYGALEIFEVAETLLSKPDEREYRRGITVRKANPDDAEAIAEITWSWIDRWYKTKLGKIYETSREELTPEEMETQAGSHCIPENIRQGLAEAPKLKSLFYVAAILGKVVGFVDFPWGLVDEPEPWGKRLGGLISIHKEYADTDVAEALLQRASEAGGSLGADYVELLPLVQAPRLAEPIERALKRFHGAKRVDYAYLRAHVSEVPTDHSAAVWRGTEDALLFRRLNKNRSFTWANQSSAGVVKDYPMEERHMLVTIDERTCGLEFYEEFTPDEASLELYPDPEDWNDKPFIQEAVKAGAEVAKKRGYKKIEVVVEKTYEPWLKELGFKEWKPETEYEKLTGKSHEGRFWNKGPNYLIKT